MGELHNVCQIELGKAGSEMRAKMRGIGASYSHSLGIDGKTLDSEGDESLKKRPGGKLFKVRQAQLKAIGMTQNQAGIPILKQVYQVSQTAGGDGTGQVKLAEEIVLSGQDP